MFNYYIKDVTILQKKLVLVNRESKDKLLQVLANKILIKLVFLRGNSEKEIFLGENFIGDLEVIEVESNSQ
ncbi:hypothetical protein ACOJIU_16910 [Carnobacterium maltaromaticum]|uniref:hypothetical protein n=1 Tax=Carnobacterium maltaromaticum TaxID=2751 RepID=UPI000704BFC0|nr:hypothetical protein IV76_GL000984 [Carnobacterium maltaromaticum]TFJ70993.1 hypothetical protein CKN94_14850 [Carnobacterium maltaromaticum]TFJ76208.1 hypothetical protein CKN97_14840 [Carnobacterium maltaromaticum]CAD5897318.1 conserved hypothetical protein [Carnobacterium maltaromaticum]CRH19527.1 hypothetical protein CM318V1_470097 [Carnobacterium maltaromaticum]